LYVRDKNVSFFKNEELEGKTCPAWGWYQWDRGGYKERV
jgi:hypothetical protein